MEHRLFETNFLSGGRAEWMHFDDPLFPKRQPAGADLYRLSGGWGIMDFCALPGKLYTIYNNKYRIGKSVVSGARIDREFFEISFLVRGGGSIEMNGIHVDLKPFQFNISYFPYVTCKTRLNAGMKGESLDVHLSYDCLYGFFDQFPEIIGPLLEAFEKKVFYRSADFYPFANKKLTAIVVFIRDVVNMRAVRRYAQYRALNQHVYTLLLETFWAIRKLWTPNLTNQQKQRLTGLQDGFFQVLGTADPSPRDVAGYVGVKPAHLNLLLKEQHNQLAATFIFEQRMKFGRQLLTENELSLKQVASILGYSNDRAFANSFKRLHGVSPWVYRHNWNLRDRCNKRFE